MFCNIFLVFILSSKLCYCSFLFNNVTLVERLAYDMGEDYCNCIVVQRSKSDSYEQTQFLVSLTESMAKGIHLREGNSRLQTMSYLLNNYLRHYTGESNLQTGNCFKWLNIVMVTEETNSILQQFKDPIIFRQAVWLLFVNGSTTNLFENVNLQIDSSVWLIEGKSNNSAIIKEVYRTASYGKEQRNCLGSWSFENGLEFEMDTKTVRRKDLTGAVFRVGTYSIWPITSIRKNEENGELIVDGYYPKVWQELQSILNFTSRYVMSIENNTGAMSKERKWTGLLGMSVENKIDVILIELDYSTSRLNIVEHLLPISRTNFQIFSRVEGYSFDWLAVFRPFYIDIWIALLLWVIVGALILAFTSQITFYFGISTIKLSYIDAVFFVLRTFSYQGSSRVPHVWTGRVLFIICYMVAAIILPSYSAALISSLAKRSPTKPFDSLAEALQTDYNIIVPPKTSSFEFFSESKDPVLQKVIEEKNKSESWLNTISGYNETINFLCENKKTAVFTIEAPMVKSIRELPAACQLQFLSQPVSQVYQSVAFRKHSPYRTTANYFILRMMETGLLRRFQVLYLQPRPLKPPKYSKPVDLADVSEIFMFLIFSYLLSGLILIFEKQVFGKCIRYM